jgi:hypothetical protein
MAVIFLLPSAPAQAANPLVTVALWKMDEPSGAATMVDSSGEGHDGANFGVKTGRAGFEGAAYFYGKTSPSFTRVLDSDLLDPSTHRFRVSLHFRVANLPPTSNVDLIRKGLSTTSGGDWKLQLWSTGRVDCLFRGSEGTVRVVSPVKVSTDHWHEVICKRSSNALVLSVDSTVTKQLGRAGEVANDAPVNLGAKDEAGADSFVGKLDEVRIERS